MEYKLISLEEIEDEALFASPYFCGSIGKEEKKDNYSKYTKINTLPTVAAAEALERYFQEEFSGMVSIEYGGNEYSGCDVYCRLIE